MDKVIYTFELLHSRILLCIRVPIWNTLQAFKALAIVLCHWPVTGIIENLQICHNDRFALLFHQHIKIVLDSYYGSGNT
jgi:hypothetical protein